MAERFFNQSCTDSEKEELARWIAGQPEDGALRDVLEAAWKKHNADTQMPDVVSERILSKLFQQQILPGENELSGKVVPLYPMHVWVRIAAAIVIILGIGFVSYSWLKRSNEAPIAVVQPVKKAKPADVAPGGNKAILTLGDGSTIVLDNAKNGSLGQQGNVRIVKPASGELVYTAANAKTDKVVYNTVTTPNGGQFQIQLPDGTNVWLNAASSLRFPTTFSGAERKVTITGEVYFEVAKDAKKPFRVQVQDMDVTVLGTHFNVMAYPGEKVIRTTLLEGKVMVKQAGRVVSLSPGQQARLVQDRSSLNVVDEVDTDEEMAWKNGLFQFSDASLDDVMRQVARWYDVEVVYEGSTPTGHFTGKLSRNTNLSKMLQIFTLSDIRYRIEGKKLIVMR
ncbi:FecR family protein [Spirosoma sp. KNUC1025]|uniref:FecR family protein n=1 Tax=Spirosoma sp. KNUC1025 TaxID=2894082 RepID=UPI003864E52E|nr:FecR domain-containing protein [Spirosoma sp. KNUC1025]